ncbi:restriction endonuclease [bacterium]|nr:restriction endonuclease [bacterium]
MEKNYLMVRAMNSAETDFKAFFNNNVVAVGWSKVDLSKYDSSQTEQLIEEIEKCYYTSDDILPQVVGRQLNQVRRFHKINSGDFIIIPFYNSIRLAIADEKRIYDKGAYDSDLANQRKVNYLFVGSAFKTIPRDVLSEALQRRLRVRGSTVSDLYEFKDEIEKLFSKDSYSWISDFEEKEGRLKNVLKQKLIQKIITGKTNLKTGGIGLENLVKELFECEGYKSEVLPKNSKLVEGAADADIFAIKSDKFQEETKILIQVKHHSGYSNDWGLTQLKLIKTSSKYKDHKFVFITSAEIAKDVRKTAEDNDIVAMDGNELSEWIIDNLDKLSADTKRKLGISAIPQFNEDVTVSKLS